MKKIIIESISFIGGKESTDIQSNLVIYNDLNEYLKLQIFNEEDEIGTLSLQKHEVELLIDILKNYNKGLKEIKY